MPIQLCYNIDVKKALKSYGIKQKIFEAILHPITVAGTDSAKKWSLG
jgi:hypothetical protein